MHPSVPSLIILLPNNLQTKKKKKKKNLKGKRRDETKSRLKNVLSSPLVSSFVLMIIC